MRVVVSKLPVKLLAIAFGGRLLRFGAGAETAAEAARAIGSDTRATRPPTSSIVR